MEISEEGIDAIRELINIGVGRAAGLLSDMTGTHIRLDVPEVRILRLTDLTGQSGPFTEDHLAGGQLSAVTLKFRGSFTGTSILVFPPESAAILITALTGEKIEPSELDALRIETLNEVGNIVNNAVMGSMTNMLDERLMYSMPTYLEGNIEEILSEGGTRHFEWIILARSFFNLQDLKAVGTILIIFEIGSLDSLLEKILAAGRN